LRNGSLALLNQCLDRVSADQDVSRTLDPALLEHARRLFAAHDDGQPDIAVLSTVGWFHWFRLIALDGKSPEEKEMAVKAFARCQIYDDTPLPQMIVPHVLDEALDLATDLLHRTATSDDPLLADQAVDAWRRIEVVMSADNPNRAAALNNLRVALLLRFGDTLELADLEEAVAAGRQAVQAATADDPDRVTYLIYLGDTLQMWSRQAEEPAHAEAALPVWEQVLQILPAESPHQAASLSGFGHALLTRAVRTESLEDLDKAIALWRQAVHISSADHPDRGRYLSNLGLALKTRYDLTADPAYLEEAIAVREQAGLAAEDAGESE
jgi:tetratricopeptide (TPR) repeat protein